MNVSPSIICISLGLPHGPIILPGQQMKMKPVTQHINPFLPPCNSIQSVIHPVCIAPINRKQIYKSMHSNLFSEFSDSYPEGVRCCSLPLSQWLRRDAGGTHSQEQTLSHESPLASHEWESLSYQTPPPSPSIPIGRRINVQSIHYLLHRACVVITWQNKLTCRDKLTWWVASSGSPPLMRTPCWAPTPVPTMTAVGMASPRAHGHAITKTEMAWRNASLTL